MLNHVKSSRQTLCCFLTLTIAQRVVTMRSLMFWFKSWMFVNRYQLNQVYKFKSSISSSECFPTSACTLFYTWLHALISFGQALPSFPFISSSIECFTLSSFWAYFYAKLIWSVYDSRSVWTEPFHRFKISHQWNLKHMFWYFLTFLNFHPF